MALSRRNTLPPLPEPQYHFCDVPKCKRDLSTSCIVQVKDRDVWTRMLGELQLLCNEAAERNEAKQKELVRRYKSGEIRGIPPSPPLWTGKPLSLEYIADRMDLDDPLHGYIVRSRREGWLQGFVTVTTFTTWQSWFIWDSRIDEAGVYGYDMAVDSPRVLKQHHLNGPPQNLDDIKMTTFKSGSREKKELEWKLPRKVDINGTIADALNAQIRDGDPKTEGVIWPHVAEISLLGGLGCGSALLRLVLEELESEDSQYDYVVLQATENSVPFYESLGFIRVGAVARYEEKKKAKHNNSSEPGSKQKKTDVSTKVPLPAHEEPLGIDENGSQEFPKVEGVSSPFEWHVVKDGESPKDIARQYNVDVDDVLFMNRRIHDNMRVHSKLVNGTVVRVPRLSSSSVQEHIVGTSWDTLAMAAMDNDIGKVSSNGCWYRALDDETPRKIAKKLGVSLRNLLAVNRHRYEGLTQNSLLRSGTQIRIPGVVPMKQNLVPVGFQSNDCLIKAQKPTVKMPEKLVSSYYDPQEGLTELIQYRHWAFADDNVMHSCPSYMMAKPLRKGENVKELQKFGSVTEKQTWKASADLVNPPQQQSFNESLQTSTNASETSVTVTTKKIETVTKSVKESVTITTESAEAVTVTKIQEQVIAENTTIQEQIVSENTVPVARSKTQTVEVSGTNPILRTTQSNLETTQKQEHNDADQNPLTTVHDSNSASEATIVTNQVIKKDVSKNGKLADPQPSMLDLLDDLLEERPLHVHTYTELAEGKELNPPKQIRQNSPKYSPSSPKPRSSASRLLSQVANSPGFVDDANSIPSPSRRAMRSKRYAAAIAAESFKRPDKAADQAENDEINSESVREKRVLGMPNGGHKARVFFKSMNLDDNARWANRCVPGILCSLTKDERKKLGIYKPRTGKRKSSRRSSVETETKPNCSFTANRKPLKLFRQVAPVFRGIDSGDDENSSNNEEESESEEDDSSIEYIDEETYSDIEMTQQDPFSEPRKRVFRFGKGKRSQRPTEQDFIKVYLVNAPITGPVPVLLPKPLPTRQTTKLKITNSQTKTAPKLEEPVKPRGRGNAFLLFCNKMRKGAEFAGKPMSEVNKMMSQKWAQLTDKSEFQKLSELDAVRYAKEMKEYREKLLEYQNAGGTFDPSMRSKVDAELHKKLINKVVTLSPKSGEQDRARVISDPKPLPESAKYYFVLTYIPDLQWCRLAPLQPRGSFTYGKYMGQPKWMLVPEGQGHEVDVSASRCEIIHEARAVRGVSDADDEEWAIPVLTAQKPEPQEVDNALPTLATLVKAPELR